MAVRGTGAASDGKVGGGCGDENQVVDVRASPSVAGSGATLFLDAVQLVSNQHAGRVLARGSEANI